MFKFAVVVAAAAAAAVAAAAEEDAVPCVDELTDCARRAANGYCLQGWVNAVQHQLYCRSYFSSTL